MKYSQAIEHERPDSAGEYPMRINKYLAHKGYATRRAADELIERGVVSINGIVAKLGDKVEANDEVVVKNQGGKKKALKYFAYNKPRDIITHSPQRGEQDIKQATAAEPELAGTFPVGRLDKDSHGLIILTNDGRITDRLLNPMHTHDKEYRVETRAPLSGDFAAKMEAGVDIGDYVTKPCTVTVTGKNVFAITLTEGKKHQIRRMVDTMKNEVVDLERIRIMNVTLGKLASGAHRAIEGEELATLLKSLGL